VKTVLQLLAFWALFLVGSVVGVLIGALAMFGLVDDSRAYLDGERNSPPSTLIASALRPLVWLSTQQPGVDALRLVPGVSWVSDLADDIDVAYSSGVAAIGNGLRALEIVRMEGVFAGPRQIDVDVLRRLAEEVSSLNSHIERLPEGREVVESLPSFLRDRVVVGETEVRIGELQRAAVSGAAASHALALQLLKDERTHVFVAMTNPAEKRGVHGIIGQYAAFEIANGAITLQASGPNNDLIDPDRLPSGLSQGYESFFGDSNFEWVNMTMSPFVPDAALQMASAWERMGYERPDVVIFADTATLGTLAVASGGSLKSLNGNDLNSPELVTQYLSNGIYFDFPEDNLARKVFQDELESSIIERVLDGDADIELVARSMIHLIREGRVSLWFDNSEVQQAIMKTLISGSVESVAGNRVVVMSFNNLTGNKMDFYVQPTITVRECEGESEVRIQLTNTASREGEYPDYVVRRLDLASDRYRPGVVLGVTLADGSSALKQVLTDGWVRTSDQAFVLAEIPAFQHVVELDFGQTSVFELVFTGPIPTILVHPFVRSTDVSRQDCSR
jgi:hypothetical protein